MEKEIIEEKMDKVVNYLQLELANVRAGRANPAILNKVEIEYYGTMSPINQVAAISVPEARQIKITPWDKSMLSLIEKAILKSNVGITPTNDGQNIRLQFPDLTEERRKELAKQIKSMGEDSKVGIRNLRRECIDIVKKSDLSEDELKVEEEKIQKETDKYVAKIEDMINVKEKEIMEV